MTVMVSKCKSNVFLLIPNDGKKRTWIFDPLPVSREITRSPGWDNRSSSRLLAWASLVAQWLRICLLMQGTQVRALVWEDPTCHGAAGPVSHNY